MAIAISLWGINAALFVQGKLLFPLSWVIGTKSDIMNTVVVRVSIQFPIFEIVSLSRP